MEIGYYTRFQLFLGIIIIQSVASSGITIKRCQDFEEITSSDTSMQSVTLHNDKQGNINCSWLLDSGSTDLKLLVIIKYSIPCASSYIKLYDGSTNASVLLERMCGNITSQKVWSTSGQYAFIDLIWIQPALVMCSVDVMSTTDHSRNGCSGKEEAMDDDDYNFLTTPGFPNLYPGSTSCKWVLTNPHGFVQIDVLFSDIEDDTSLECDFDKYTIHDGEYRCENNLLVMACSEYSKAVSGSFISNGSSLVISFESDTSVNNRGFLLRYKGVKNVHSKKESSSSCTKTTKNSIQTPELAGIIVGSSVLLTFTSFVVVFLIVKIKPPLKTSIGPLQKMPQRKPDTQTNDRAKLPQILYHNKYQHNDKDDCR